MAEAERERVESHSREQEKARAELARERAAFEAEKHSQARLWDTNRRNLRKKSQLALPAASSAAARGDGEAATLVLSRVGAAGEAAVQGVAESIQEQLSKWQQERSSQEQYLQSQKRILTEIQTNVGELEKWELPSSAGKSSVAP